uniref:Putative glutamine amidotransferase-like protein C13C5.04 n=1 Tax=Talaromyces marneffei PM1 TaxID=1077442 RepID=A0A093VTP1_TALMA
MITRHIHIAVLDTDVPVPTVYAARGLYSSQFRVLLQSAATRLNQSIKNNAVSASQIQIHTSAYDVVGGSYPALGMLRKTPPLHDEEEKEEEEEEEVFRPIDAILITGSAASAYYQGEQYAWVTKLQEFIRRVWSRYPHVKFFGSCFGHQVIAQALLATPQKDSSLETPLVRVEACPMGYEIGIQPIEISREFGATALGKTFSKSLNERDGGKLHIQLIHGDRVIGFHPPSTAGASETSSLPPAAAAAALTALPQPWLNLGSTLLSPIQGLYYPGRVLTYQGHFEFDIFVNSETVIEFGRRTGWDAQMVAESLQKVNACGLGDDDSKAAAEIVVQFLAEDADIARQGVTETGAPMKIDYPMKAETARSAAASGLATPPEEMSLPV